MELGHWLADNGLTDYEELLEANDVRLVDVSHLTIEDLREIGLPVGARRRFLTAAARLPPPDHTVPSVGPAPHEEAWDGSELRTMTVMFCDLVGSTAMSDRMEVEMLRDVMRSYTTRVTDVVERHGGHVAKYLGDGVLAYFGWPAASEDQTVRAVRAGLEVVACVGDLDVTAQTGPLSCRVGVATGPVVIGEIAGERNAIVGRTPNLAARLEGLAEAGDVVIDDVTAALVPSDFELAPPTSRQVKGFERSVPTFRVIGPSDTPNRFAARVERRQMRPLVGRRAELAVLREAWEHAVSGDGRLVTIGGEAGIGKSRLVHELIASLEPDEHELWHFQCSPTHTSSVLYPVLRRLELAADLGAAVDADDRRDRLRAHLAGWPDAGLRAVPLIAALLDLGLDEATQPADPGRRKNDLLEIIVTRLEAAARERPVLVVLEDLHWSDPTTLELVHRSAGRIAHLPVLIAATHRPEFDMSSLGTVRLTSLNLDGLPTSQVRTLARSIVGGGIDEATIDDIARRTDGNPLFVEELAPIATEFGRDHPDRVPTSLMASLVAQIDRLPGSKRVAQMAAVIGRDFSQRLLHTLVGEREDADPLEQLLASGLVQRSPFVDGEFVFKHALVRDAAYGTLLPSDRRALHGRIAHLLAVDAVQTAAPDVIAQHFAAAEQWLDAAEHFAAAGRRAVEAGASPEARTHLQAALDALGRVEPGPRRDELELGVLLDLAPVVMTMRNFGSPDAAKHYQRAAELAATVGDEDQRFTALWGSYYITEIRADWKQSTLDVERLLQLDTSRLREDLHIQIHHAAATWAGSTGNVRVAIEHNRREIELYDRDLHARHRYVFGAHDPCVCAYGQTGLGLAMIGSPHEALSAARQSVDLARQLDHPPSTAMALWFLASTLHDLDLIDEARAAIDETVAYCAEHGAIAIGRSTEIRRLAVLDDRREAYEGFMARLDPMRERDRRGFLIPSFATLAAEAAIDVGEIEHALTTLEYGEQVALDSGELLDLGNLLYQRGRALEAVGPADEAAAIEAHRAALAFCRETGRNWIGLRPAVALARILARRGDVQEGIDVVSSALSAFPEELHWARIDDARSVLHDLN